MPLVILISIKMMDFIYAILPIVRFMVVMMESMRLLIGDKDPKIASPGTIRGDLSTSLSENTIHGSDSVESSKRELDLWFSRE